MLILKQAQLCYSPIMILYVDETECPEYFIVTGLLVRSKEDVALAFKKFKNKISDDFISKHYKTQIFTEFKSTLIDRNFQKIKFRMLEEINSIDHNVIYSCYIKKGKHFSQKEKERAYINMISKIVSSIEDTIEVVFDTFNKKDFESNIIKKLLSFKHITASHAADSQKEDGIKFVDNLCSVVRLHKTNLDESDFYAIIMNSVKEV